MAVRACFVTSPAAGKRCQGGECNKKSVLLVVLIITPYLGRATTRTISSQILTAACDGITGYYVGGSCHSVLKFRLITVKYVRSTARRIFHSLARLQFHRSIAILVAVLNLYYACSIDI